jgi:hypothetical protein
VLHKREGAQTLSQHRVIVGRPRNSDVVLRDPSVSKLPAWLERADDGRYFVSDAGSHNGTRGGADALVPRKPWSVAAGDLVQFGNVQATFCPAGDFWDLVAEL